MSEKELQNTLSQLQSISNHNLQNASSLLSRAKIQLLQLNALVPTPQTSPAHLALARDVLETGALLSIRQKDPEAFTRYFLQLQPFYSLDSSRWSGAPSAGRTIRSGTSSSDASRGNQSKVTGLYLLLLLSQGDYAGFHTVIEGLESQYGHKSKLDEDKFILYPLRLEQALMEGSYDRVWGETKGERVPSEEFGVFSEVLINTIRSEIASCSERAYPSLPIANAKNLLFLDSEGAVIEFAQSRGWVAREGRIYFPQQAEEASMGEKDILVTSGQVIQNTLGYARKLETIV